jgi:nucleoporin NUP159
MPLHLSNKSTVLIFSTLEDLRSAFPGAKEDNDDLFNPKRTLSLQSKPNIVIFAFGDTRIFVGLEDGHVLVYDTSALFSSGTDKVGVLASTQIQRPALRQIVPNPGTEPGLSDLVAIVGQEKVHLFNVKLEPQGGWTATDTSSRPVAGVYLSNPFRSA